MSKYVAFNIFSYRSLNMAQAKTLTTEEMEQVLRYISNSRYAVRNRCLILTSFWSGMRVAEIANLKMRDVLNENHTIKTEIRLSAAQTKGNEARVVFIPQKLRDEFARYLKTRKVLTSEIPFFHTSKRLGFTPNTLCQWFFWTYKRAGFNNASSHSGRRSFITYLATKGVPVRVLASLAGHKSITVTQRYIDVNDEMKRNAVELI
jgi:integrase/recombinase XerD